MPAPTFNLPLSEMQVLVSVKRVLAQTAKNLH
jgi:hypothetical protein